MTYGVSVARAISHGAEVVGEFNGRANLPTARRPGTEDRGLLRFGARYTMGPCVSTAACLLGLTSRDPELGFTAGLTWVFNAFHVPVMLAIAKAHAYGNDFLFVPAEQVEGVTARRAVARACATGTPGIGGDGLIYYTIAPDGTARMKLINADGSPSELSGNGLRCLAALVMHQREAAQLPPAHRSARRHRRRVEDAGARRPARRGATRSARRWGSRSASPKRRCDAAGETHAGHDAGHRQSAVRGARARAARPRRASIGSGPALATHARFPPGTNVEFADVEAPDRVRILIWERGVGPTHASGTGACASAVAAIAHGGAARDVDVIAPGGTQRVEWTGDGVFLTGWAEVVFDGHWVPSHADLS